MAQFIVEDPDKRTEAERVADGLLARANQFEEFIVNFHQTCFELLWNHPDPEVTPDAVFARMGEQGQKYLLKAYNLVQYMLSEGVELPTEKYTPPRKYTVDEVGTIKLDDKK